MAVLNFITCASGGTEEAQSISGNLTVVSAADMFSDYAIRANPTTTGLANFRVATTSATGVNTTSFNTANLYMGFYFKVVTAPTSGDEEVFVVLDTGGTAKASGRMNPSRQLVIYNTGGSVAATGTTALTVGQVYWVEYRGSSGSAAAAYEVRIDSVSELSGTMTQTNNNHGSVRLGKATNNNNNAYDFRYSNWVGSDTAYVGPISTKGVFPDANGSTQQFTGGTNASGYLEVDDIPADDDTTYVASTGAANNVALFRCASMPSSSSVKAVKGWARAKTPSGTSSTKLRVRSGSTNSDSTGSALGSSYVNRFRLLENDPNTGSPWLEADVNAAEVGVQEANAVVTRLTTCCLHVAYVPGSPPAPPTVKSLAALGAG